MARVNGLNKEFIALIKPLNAAIMQPHQMHRHRRDYLRLVTARGLMTTGLLFVLDFLFIHRAENLFLVFGLRLDKKISPRKEKKPPKTQKKIISSEKLL